jgi:NAD+ kinase
MDTLTPDRRKAEQSRQAEQVPTLAGPDLTGPDPAGPHPFEPDPFAPMNRPASLDRIAFVASTIPEAQQAMERLARRYGGSQPDDADVIVALGGDGLMLQTLHNFMNTGKPIYGMNRGTVGFLMNDFREDDLKERLAAAQTTAIHPLVMRAIDAAGREYEHHAINEVSVFRQIYQAARLRILVDGKVRLPELAADGVLLSTPAGSTAYNFSVQGPIIPIGAPLLALTPISPFRPRRWHGALLPDTARVTIEVLEAEKRPVAAVADHDEVRDVRKVDITMDREMTMYMMFDPGHSLDERILREQFGY